MCSLGRKKYYCARKLMSQHCIDVLPSWYELQQHQKSITPAILEFPNPHKGNFTTLYEAVEVTLRRLCATMKANDLTALQSSKNYLHIKIGVDGSGGHNIYQQVNNVETNNIISYMFWLLKITAENGTVLWQE